MRISEIINATERELCDRTVPCEECIFNEKGYYYCTSRDCAKKIIKLGYRKVADDDDEIVESMKTYERARQETAREILQRLWEERNALGQLMVLETDLTKLAKEYDIELE